MKLFARSLVVVLGGLVCMGALSSVLAAGPPHSGKGMVASLPPGPSLNSTNSQHPGPDGSYTIQALKGVAVYVIRAGEYNTFTCALIDDGQYTTVIAPTEGTLSYTIEPYTFPPGGNCAGVTIPANVARYTWTANNNGKTPDSFEIKWMTSDQQFSFDNTYTAQLTSGCPTGTTLSDPSWTKQFPGSTSLSDLQEPFRTSATQFVAALRNAHANIQITATFRPIQRAWLMHYSYDIVSTDPNYHIDPRNVPSRADIPICWVHTKTDGTYDQKASVAAALAMVNAYGISPFSQNHPLLVPPSLTSNHTRGWAMDMIVSWSGTLTISNASGQVVKITSPPRTSMNQQLWQVAASYAVYHYGTDKSTALPSKDPFHWSIDGK